MFISANVEVFVDSLIAMLRAAGDPTRLRLLLLLRQAELTVSELIEIVGQSQPRVSRHLKLLCEAALLERFKEGSWVFYRASERGEGAEFGTAVEKIAARRRARGARRRSGRLLQGQCCGVGTHPRAACPRKGCGSGDRSSYRGLADGVAARCGNRNRTHAGIARAACEARRRRRRQSGDAFHRARSPGARQHRPRTGAPRRHLSAAVSQRLVFARLRRGSLSSGVALSRRSGRSGRGSGARDAAGRALVDRRFRAARSRIPAQRFRPSPAWIFRSRSAGLVCGSRIETAGQRGDCGRQEQTHGEALARPVAGQVAGGGGMSLNDLVTDERRIEVSFEFQPPKTPEAEADLWKAIRRLEPLAPAFVSVTYGAGGSTRERTHATVKRIVDETSLKPAAHLTCVAHSRREIEEIVRGYWEAGIRHIVALRGDMPGMSGP